MTEPLRFAPEGFPFLKSPSFRGSWVDGAEALKMG